MGRQDSIYWVRKGQYQKFLWDLNRADHHTEGAFMYKNPPPGRILREVNNYERLGSSIHIGKFHNKCEIIVRFFGMNN